MDEINLTNGNTHKETARRPLVLTLLCLFSFVFFGLVLVLFLLALFWSGTVADMVFRYAPEYSLTRFGVYLYIFCGLILHAVSFTGIIFIWKMKRLGYLLLGPSSLDSRISIIRNTDLIPYHSLLYCADHCFRLFPEEAKIIPF